MFFLCKPNEIYNKKMFKRGRKITELVRNFMWNLLIENSFKTWLIIKSQNHRHKNIFVFSVVVFFCSSAWTKFIKSNFPEIICRTKKPHKLSNKLCLLWNKKKKIKENRLTKDRSIDNIWWIQTYDSHHQQQQHHQSNYNMKGWHISCYIW